MFVGLAALFKGDNLRPTLIAIAAIFVALGLFGSVAYAGYSWAKSGEEKRMDAVKEAMREVFDQEKQDLINTYRRADDINAAVAEIKQTIAKSAGQQTSAIDKLRGQFKEVYEILIPPEGVEQWEKAREMYNAAARRRSPQSR